MFPTFHPVNCVRDFFLVSRRQLGSVQTKHKRKNEQNDNDQCGQWKVIRLHSLSWCHVLGRAVKGFWGLCWAPTDNPKKAGCPAGLSLVLYFNDFDDDDGNDNKRNRYFHISENDFYSA